MPTYLEQSLAKLEEFEGSIPWMYLDTIGKVTVAVGLMLPDFASALHLPFMSAGQPATEDQIASEFQRVHAMPMGRPAQFYHRAGGPELQQSDIDSLLRTVLLGFEGELRKTIPAYDSFADGAKLALLDMIYNLGPAGLFHGYPSMMKAVNAGDWAQAAANCFRRGPRAARNQWTQSMFLSCVDPNAPTPDGMMKKVGFGLLGLSVAAVQKVSGKS